MLKMDVTRKEVVMKDLEEMHNSFLLEKSNGNSSKLFCIVVVNIIWLPIFSIVMTSIECVSSVCTSRNFIGDRFSQNGFLDSFLSNFFNIVAYMVFFPPIGLIVIIACCGVGYIFYLLNLKFIREFPFFVSSLFNMSLGFYVIACLIAFTPVILMLTRGSVYEGLNQNMDRIIVSLDLTIILIVFFLPVLNYIWLRIMKSNNASQL
jgi:hypothetical protein